MQEPRTLFDILYQKYERQTLASVYIARYKNDEELKLFQDNFLQKLSKLDDHPDLLKIKLNENESGYKVESIGIKSLLNFINFSPVELKTRFIFLYDAHLISDIVSNKLLKIFEELPKNFCLFLLCPTSESLLATVESRAIKINLPNLLKKDHSIPTPFTKHSTLNHIHNTIKEADEPQMYEKLFLTSKCDEILQKKTYKECNDVLLKLKHYELSENFNNSKLSRLALFF